MNYDIWGSWSPGVGPNAALNDTCAPPHYRQGSAVNAVRSWTSAGLPRNQLVLGVLAYGHSFLVNESVALTEQGEVAAYPQFEPTQPRGDSADDVPGVDVCGAETGWGVPSISGDWSRVNYWMRKAYLSGAFITDTMNAVKRYVLGVFSFSTAGLMKGMYVISHMFITPPRKLWFCLTMPSRSRPKESSSKTMVCEMWEAAGDYHDTSVRELESIFYKHS